MWDVLIAMSNSKEYEEGWDAFRNELKVRGDDWDYFHTEPNLTKCSYVKDSYEYNEWLAGYFGSEGAYHHGPGGDW